jgi:hypothetical protein
MFLRQPPHLIERQGRSCVLEFLDIAKAYDTIDRDFLVEEMQVMGAGAGLIGRVQLILRNTASGAVVNRFPSGLFQLRQGLKRPQDNKETVSEPSRANALPHRITYQRITCY